MAEVETHETGGKPDTPPLTFESAYAADTSPVSDPPASDSSTTPAAVQPGAAQGSPQTIDDRSPYIPRARFDEVNTRLKAAEAEAQTLAWAKTIDQQQLADAIQFYGRYKGDAVEFIQELIQDAQTDPVAGAKLRSIAARALAQGRGQQAPPQAPTTLPVIQLEDGSSVDLNALRTQWLEEAKQTFAPVAQTVAEVKAERDQIAAEKQADTWSSQFMSQIKSLPNYAEARPKMEADLSQMIKSKQIGDNPFDLENAVRALYIKYAVPLQEASAQSRHLDDLQRKAAASTGINPGSAAAASPKRPTSFLDKSLKW